MNTKMQTKKAKRGFTITELVIVIAVIAILAAVLIPTFSNVINRANESAALQEARNEWVNLSSCEDVATANSDTNDYLIQYSKEGKKAYFIVEDGQFNENALSGVSMNSTEITWGTDNAAYSTKYGNTAAALTVEDYTKENKNVTIYKLTDQTADAGGQG